jgi:hypothetical protein
MKLARRRRRWWGKWATTSAVVLIIAVWLASGWWVVTASVLLAPSHGVGISLGGGGIGVSSWTELGGGTSHRGVRLAPIGSRAPVWQWAFAFREMELGPADGVAMVYIPLWALVLVPATAAAFLWYADRRRHHGDPGPGADVRI